MDADDDRKRVADMTARILEIETQLAAGKRDFFTGGKGHSIAERAALEAERANLRYQRHVLNGKIESEKAANRARSHAAFIAVLCAELESRGLGEVIEVTRAKLNAQAEGVA